MPAVHVKLSSASGAVPLISASSTNQTQGSIADNRCPVEEPHAAVDFECAGVVDRRAVEHVQIVGLDCGWRNGSWPLADLNEPVLVPPLTCKMPDDIWRQAGVVESVAIAAEVQRAARNIRACCRPRLWIVQSSVTMLAPLPELLVKVLHSRWSLAGAGRSCRRTCR